MDVRRVETGSRNGRKLPMNEQQVRELLKAMEAQTKAISDQTAAISRLAESNESLAAVLYQYFSDEVRDELPAATYLSGKPKE